MSLNTTIWLMVYLIGLMVYTAFIQSDINAAYFYYGINHSLIAVLLFELYTREVKKSMSRFFLGLVFMFNIIYLLIIIVSIRFDEISLYLCSSYEQKIGIMVFWAIFFIGVTLKINQLWGKI